MSRRTRQRKEREMAERAAKSGFTKQWEYRTMRFMVRLIVYLFFFSYVGFAASLTWNWFQTKWVRMQPVEQSVEVAKKSLDAKPQDPETLRRWLAMRPFTEGEELIKLMDPYASRMGGMTFILYAGWYAHAGKLDEAVFWRQYARWRIRYDALRCGSYNAVELINEILADVPQPDIQQYMMDHPDQLPGTLVKILQYDKAHPAENDPAAFCESLTKSEEFKNNTKVLPSKPAEWPGLYGGLRGVTKAEIYGMILEARKNGKELVMPPGLVSSPEDKDKDKDKDKSKDADKAKPCPAAPKGKKGKPAEPCADPKKTDDKEPATP